MVLTNIDNVASFFLETQISLYADTLKSSDLFRMGSGIILMQVVDGAIGWINLC